MRKSSRVTIAAVVLTGAVAYAAGQGNLPVPQSLPVLQRTQDSGAIQNPNMQSPSEPQPTVTVYERGEVQGILGKEIRSSAGEDMGRIVDVIVDGSGQVRAVIIDFGGFLGVGNRKVAVAWNALRFSSESKDPKKVGRIGLDLNREQVQAAPEYKEDKPVVVLGASGGLESLRFP